MGYQRSNQAAEPIRRVFPQSLDNGQTGYATAAFSNLDEDSCLPAWTSPCEFTPSLKATVGYDYTDTQRDSTRREFQIVAPSTFPNAVATLRPDYLLGPAVIDYFDIGLVETTETDPAFTAEMRTQCGLPAVAGRFDRDARPEHRRALRARPSRTFVPLQVFNTLTNSGASTSLDNDYVLPAATLTWRFTDDMQVRFNASKTIARPQFRELMFQSYFDPETNRRYRGNPLLIDSEFMNAEGALRVVFRPEQRLSIAVFYKKIDRPIEAFTGFEDNTPVTSFANAPEADALRRRARTTEVLSARRHCPTMRSSARAAPW